LQGTYLAYVNDADIREMAHPDEMRIKWRTLDNMPKIIEMAKIGCAINCDIMLLPSSTVIHKHLHQANTPLYGPARRYSSTSVSVNSIFLTLEANFVSWETRKNMSEDPNSNPSNCNADSDLDLNREP
jgi:hypothetical protein